MPSLFDHVREKKLKEEQPLAARMRPRTLDEYIGQKHILAPGRLLRRAIQADQISSLIFYGPPGTGKTTLASVIANTTKGRFVTLNAVMAGIADLRSIVKEARRQLGEFQKRTILFIDEVHRWNKSQQDGLLPWVENGTVILIGATTENPYFTVNRALVSRSRIFQLKKLTVEDISEIIQQAIGDKERGFGNLLVDIDNDALNHLSDVANGDARAALNALELAVETTSPNLKDQRIHITLDVAEESIQHRAVLYDKEGDCHYDTISAFIKSMRGSDPDATFYWLAKMVYAGEDPRFIFRRMIIFASEDIGQADPQALQFVMSAADAYDRIGMPEGHYPLAHAALYCATAPKSNSVMGFFDALKMVGSEKEGEVPNHLRDASRDKEGFGHGAGYQYPHAYRDHWVAQQYLPDSMKGKVFYEPVEMGFEKHLAEEVRRRRELQLAALRENEGHMPPPEVLTFSPTDGNTEQWLARAVDSLSVTLAAIRDCLFESASLQRHHLVLDLSGDLGVFTWEALRRVPEGGVWTCVTKKASGDLIAEQIQNIPALSRPKLLFGNLDVLGEKLQSDGKPMDFDFMVGRNVCSRVLDRKAFLELLYQHLLPGGQLALAETIPRYGQRLSALFSPPANEEGGAWYLRVRAAEEKIYHAKDDLLVNWDEKTLQTESEEAGFRGIHAEIKVFHREQILQASQLLRWFEDRPDSYAGRLLNQGLAKEDIQYFRQQLAQLCTRKSVRWETTVVYITAKKMVESR